MKKMTMKTIIMAIMLMTKIFSTFSQTYKLCFHIKTIRKCYTFIPIFFKFLTLIWCFLSKNPPF